MRIDELATEIVKQYGWKIEEPSRLHTGPYKFIGRCERAENFPFRGNIHLVFEWGLVTHTPNIDAIAEPEGIVCLEFYEKTKKIDDSRKQFTRVILKEPDSIIGQSKYEDSFGLYKAISAIRQEQNDKQGLTIGAEEKEYTIKVSATDLEKYTRYLASILMHGGVGEKE